MKTYEKDDYEQNKNLTPEQLGALEEAALTASSHATLGMIRELRSYRASLPRMQVGPEETFDALVEQLRTLYNAGAPIPPTFLHIPMVRLPEDATQLRQAAGGEFGRGVWLSYMTVDAVLKEVENLQTQLRDAIQIGRSHLDPDAEHPIGDDSVRLDAIEEAGGLKRIQQALERAKNL